MLQAFAGGVHPPEQKVTESCAIEVMPPPPKVYIPLSQHAGKPARPIVEVGARVRIGTRIAASEGFISASVHSSIAGKVIALSEWPHPVLGSSACCVIESDHTEEWEPGMKKSYEYESLTVEELVQQIKDAGIVGLGGAAFPTHVKLSPPPEKRIDHLIINGCECEPMLTADHRIMLEYPEGIVEGARLFQRILGAQHLTFGVEDNKKDAAEILKKEGVAVKLLKTKYPQGAEKQLIKALLDREVPRGGLPMDVGCVVQNVGTCYAAYQAVKFRKPLIDRVVTVTGDCVKERKNVLVKIGTPALDVLNFCGGYVQQPRKMIFGGPMMGIAQHSENVPVIKGTSGIVVLRKPHTDEEGPCVRCSRCIDACPMGLMPTELYKFVKSKNFDRVKEFGVLDCIECGCCAYGCPAAIPLVHYLKFGKSEVWRRSK